MSAHFVTESRSKRWFYVCRSQTGSWRLLLIMVLLIFVFYINVDLHFQCTISILPDSSREFLFNFYPLISGAVSPPRFHLSPVETVMTPSTPEQIFKETSSDYLQELIDRSIPSQIYIMVYQYKYFY